MNYYEAIGIQGHQYGLGECEDFIIAAQIVRDFIDDDIVCIKQVSYAPAYAYEEE